jgi:hypothetical protein
MSDEKPDEKPDSQCRGGGPATPEGKQRCAQNAVTHGLSAMGLTFASAEEQEAFEALEADIRARFDIDLDDQVEVWIATECARNIFKRGKLSALELQALMASPPQLPVNGVLPEGEAKVLEALQGMTIERAQADFVCEQMPPELDDMPLENSTPVGEKKIQRRRLEVAVRYQAPLDRLVRFRPALDREWTRLLDMLQRCRQLKEQAQRKNNIVTMPSP